MIVVDTNVLSETSKSRRDPRAIRWLYANREQLRLPTIALAELHYGVEKLPPSRQRTDLERWLAALMHCFEGRILPFDARAAREHGRLRAELRRMGKPVAAPDSYIAAVALSLGVPLATRNTKDFQHTGVELIDPWAE